MPRWFDNLVGRFGGALRRTEEAATELERGIDLEKRGHLAAAESAYRTADALGSGEAASNLGVLLYERKDVAGAESCLRRADDRGSAWGAFRLGVLLHDRGDLDGAEVAYRRGVERGNEHAAKSLAFLLATRRQRGTPDGPSSPPENAWMLSVALATEAAKKGDIAVATEILSSTCRMAGIGAPAKKLLMALLDQGNRLAGEGSPALATLMFQHSIDVARSLAHAGQHGAELAVAAAQNNMAVCLLKLDLLENAEPAFREAADIYERRWAEDAKLIDCSYADALEGYATVLARLGRFEDAVPVSTRLVTQRRLVAGSDQGRTANLAKALRRFAWVRIPLSLDLDVALTAAHEAIDLFQQVAPSAPDGMKGELALTRSILACALDKVGRNKEAADLREQFEIVGTPFSPREPV